MVPSKQVEEGSFSQSMNEPNERDGEENENQSPLSFKSLLWHGGSVYDAWFSCASNQVLKLQNPQNPQKPTETQNFFSLLWIVKLFLLQVAQVLLTLPYSFSQLGMLSGIIFQVFYGIIGSWTAYLISILYVEYRTRKEKENVSFKNHVIQVRFYRTKTKL